MSDPCHFQDYDRCMLYSVQPGSNVIENASQKQKGYSLKNKQGTRKQGTGISEVLLYASSGGRAITTFRSPHGGVRTIHQKSTCLTQSSLGPDVVQIWSRYAPCFGHNETRVVHQVGNGENLSPRGTERLTCHSESRETLIREPDEKSPRQSFHPPDPASRAAPPHPPAPPPFLLS